MNLINHIIGIIVLIIPLVAIFAMTKWDLEWELFEKRKYMRMDAFQKANPKASYEEYQTWEKGDHKIATKEE